MNKSSCFLLFILISTATSTPESEIETTIQKINSIIIELADPSISMKEAVGMCSEKINTLLSINFLYKNPSPSDLLYEYLSLSTFLKQSEIRPTKMTTEILEEETNTILDNMFPSLETIEELFKDGVEKIKSRHNPETEMKEIQQLRKQLEKKFVENLPSSIDKFFEGIQLTLSNELFDQIVNKAPKFVFTSRNNLILSFNTRMLKEMKGFYRKLKWIDQDIDKNVANQFVNYISQKNSEFVTQFRINTQKLAVLSNSPISALRYVVVVLLNQAVVQNTITDKSTTEKMLRIIEVMGQLSLMNFVEENPTPELDLKVLFDYLTYYISNHSTDIRINNNADLAHLINKLTSEILIAMNKYTSKSDLLELLSIAFANEESLQFDSDRVSFVISLAYQSLPFSVNIDEDESKDIAQKLRLIDYILHLKPDDFSDERFNLVVSKIELLLNVSNVYRKFSFQLKSLVNLKIMEIAPNQQFYLKLYLTANDFISTSSKTDSFDEIHERFDQYIDTIFSQNSNEFVTSNYLIIKMVNLVFVNPSSSYETSFQTFEENSDTVNHAQEILNANSVLKSKFDYCFSMIKDRNLIEKKDVKSKVKLMLFSDLKINASLFASVNKKITKDEKQIENQISKRNKIQIEFVKDSGLSQKKSSRSSKINSDSHRTSSNLQEKRQIPSEELIDPIVDDEEIISTSNLHDEERNSRRSDEKMIHTSVIEEAEDEDEQFEIEEEDLLRNKNDEGVIGIDSAKQVEKKNIVNEIIGRLPKEDIIVLQNVSVDEYINNHDIVITKDNVETTYTFIKVTRKDSPCHPQRQH